MGSQSLSRTRRSNQSLERIESGRSEPSIPAKLIQVAAPASERNPLASLWPSKLRLIQVKGQGCSWGNGLLHLYLSIYLSISLSLYTFLAILLSLCGISVPLKVPEYVAPTNAQKKSPFAFLDNLQCGAWWCWLLLCRCLVFHRKQFDHLGKPIAKA